MNQHLKQDGTGERVLHRLQSLDQVPPDVAKQVEAYRNWSRRRRELRLQEIDDHNQESQPTIGFLTVVRDPTPLWLSRCLQSISTQSSDRWTLTIVEVGEPHSGLLESLNESLGDRLGSNQVQIIRSTQAISEVDAIRQALDSTHADVVAILGQHDELEGDAVHWVGKAFSDPDVDLVYTDEDEIDDVSGLHQPRLKPAWSPELLLSCPYLGRLLAIRRSLLLEVGGIRVDAGDAWEYDLMLRATERTRNIVHVPDVLYHRRARWLARPGTFEGPIAAVPVGNEVTIPSDGSESYPADRSKFAYDYSSYLTPISGVGILDDALLRRGVDGWVEPGQLPGTWHTRRRISGTPRVSMIVPFRDNPRLLRACVDSVLATTADSDIEVEMLLVNNGSTDPETHSLVDRLHKVPMITVLHDPSPFNWASINNNAISAATGDLLLFLNDDVEALRPGWLTAMVEQVQQPDVGAVGARLLYPDGTLQHAGTVIGKGGAASHLLRGLPAAEPGYLAQTYLPRECTAVTGACLMVRREIHDLVGGFDESLAVDMNDVDYCLKIWKRGYRIVYTPRAELIHHESPSRGASGSISDILRFIERWDDVIRSGDPFLNRHITRIDSSCSIQVPWDNEGWWDQWLESLKALQTK